MAITLNWFLIVFVAIIPTALLCLLQWWLSGRKSPAPGLILPALHLIVTIVLLVAVSIYSFSGATTVTGYEQIDSETVEQLQEASGDVRPTPPPIPATPDREAVIGIIGGADGPTAVFVSGPDDLSLLIPPFLLLNVPTYIYLIIYFVQRRRLRRRKTVDKTRIQDM